MEHWAAKANPLPQGESPQSPVSTMSSSYASLYSRNEPYIREVIESSRTVLRHVLDVLLPDDHLKHAPVRTYFRIFSAAMFLLKVNHPLHPNFLPLTTPLDLRPRREGRRSSNIAAPVKRHGQSPAY